MEKIEDIIKEAVWFGEVIAHEKLPLIVEFPFGKLKVPHSELAIHTKIAGEKIIAYACGMEKREDKWYPRRCYVLVETSKPDRLGKFSKVVEGLPTEVIPIEEVKRNLEGRLVLL